MAEASSDSARADDRSEQVLAALGVAIADRRRTLRMSQDRLASKAGLHRTYVSEIERNARNMSVRTLVQIAQALDMSISELMQHAEDAGGAQA